MVVERTGQLHPALYYGGLLKAARRAGARLCAQCDAEKIERKTGGFRVLTSKGPIEAREVVIATNGYTTDLTPTLRRRLVPVASHIIATEELPEDLVKSLIPRNRVVSDTKRVLCYYRQSPDNKRVIFGGRARFNQSGCTTGMWSVCCPWSGPGIVHVTGGAGCGLSAPSEQKSPPPDRRLDPVSRWASIRDRQSRSVRR
jgi:glycine/D-amino acid oxidase-like deaminating enzyme